MALFKILQGSSANFKADLANATPAFNKGYCYFVKDEQLFYIDYLDAEGNPHRKALNAIDSQTLLGATLVDEIRNSALEIPTSKAIFTEIARIDTELAALGIDSITELRNTKMDKVNPTGSGSFSMNGGYVGSNNNSFAWSADINAPDSASATGLYSFAMGIGAVASGKFSFSRGDYTTASGEYSIADGQNTNATAAYAYAQGQNSTAAGQGAHAEGEFTLAEGKDAHAEGFTTEATGDFSHAEGNNTSATHKSQHVEGEWNTIDPSDSDATSRGTYAHIIGNGTSDTARSNAFTVAWNGDVWNARALAHGTSTAEGENSYAGGSGAYAEGVAAHAEGSSTEATGDFSHAEGSMTTSEGIASHAEGENTWAKGFVAHAEGDQAQATGDRSHAEGYKTIASEDSSHAEGSSSSASGNAAHAEGYGSSAEGQGAHSEGCATRAVNQGSHAEGGNRTDTGLLATDKTIAASAYSSFLSADVVIKGPIARGHVSHAEGFQTYAHGWASHAEGISTKAFTSGAHAEGDNTEATGLTSHAEGLDTIAKGNYSHAQNRGTIANGENQTAIGKFNVADTTSAFIIGKGTANNARSNAFTVDWNGNTYSARALNIGTTDFSAGYALHVAGFGYFDGNVTVTGNLTAATAPTNDSHLANKKYVDDNLMRLTHVYITATEGQSIFDFTGKVGNLTKPYYLVYFNGLLLVPGLHYDVNGTQKIVLKDWAATAGDVCQIVSFKPNSVTN